MSYMSFKARIVEIFPTDSQKTELEKIFSAIRTMHNYFITQMQKLNDEEAKLAIRGYEELKIDLINMVDQGEAGEYDYLVTIDRSILDSHLRIIAQSWQDFYKDSRQRPRFKEARHQQSFWILDRETIEIDERSVMVPGDVKIKLELPYGEFYGKATALRIVRSSDNRYFVICLYELPSLTPDPHQEKIITLLGIRIRKLKTNAVLQQRNIWKRARRNTANPYEHEASLLRKSVLGRLVKQHFTKKLRKRSTLPQQPTTKENQHECCQD